MVFMSSCEDDRLYESFYPVENLTITAYLEAHQEEFSTYLRLLEEANYKGSLSAYNPYGKNFTLFLPTNEAFEEYFLESEDFKNINDLLNDKVFLEELVKYHIVNSEYETNDFPFGALGDTTATGDFLTISIDTSLSKLKINGEAYILEPNVSLINGYIHVIDKVLKPINYTIYEWLLKQPDLSILQEALLLTGFSDSLMSDGRFTLLAETNETYVKQGIHNIEDLKLRYSAGDADYENPANGLNQYIGYHILSGIYYLNDFEGKRSNYNTNTIYPVKIDGLSLTIKINEGARVFDTIIIAGDTIFHEFIGINYENSNNQAQNGSIHLIDNLLELYLPARIKEVFQFYNDPLINDIKNIEGTTDFTPLAGFQFISWTGTDVLTYVKSGTAISGVFNNDYIILDGDFTFTYTIPRILPGKYNLNIVAHAYSELNATIMVKVDGKYIGGNVDLTTGGRSTNNYYNFTIGTLEFGEYDSHSIEISTLIPGRFRCDRFEFTPIN